MKEAIGIVAAILTFVGYIPYIRDTVKGKTTPHIYTWFIWGLVTSIAFGLQIGDDAGAGSLVTFAAAIVCFVVFGLGARHTKQNITKGDSIFFVLSLAALILWLFAKQPLLSILLVSLLTCLGLYPPFANPGKNLLKKLCLVL